MRMTVEDYARSEEEGRLAIQSDLHHNYGVALHSAPSLSPESSRASTRASLHQEGSYGSRLSVTGGSHVLGAAGPTAGGGYASRATLRAARPSMAAAVGRASAAGSGRSSLTGSPEPSEHALGHSGSATAHNGTRQQQHHSYAELAVTQQVAARIARAAEPAPSPSPSAQGGATTESGMQQQQQLQQARYAELEADRPHR
jgi:hypothetical protein